MNQWILTAPEKLVREEATVPTPEEGEVRVRVTDVLLNSVDGFVYSGILKPVYPLVPGRFAIGRVSGENGGQFKKGDRVLLHTFAQEEKLTTAKVDFSADATPVRGQSIAGFMRDFICLSEADLCAIPDSVSDETALLSELVAIAKATVDALDVHKGMHVAVIGGDTLGLIICRLLIYQQASPILIDNHTNRIEFAKRYGIYYTSPADDTLMDNVARITGGRLADGAIFVTSTGPKDKSLPFKVSARGTSTVFCGFHGQDVTVNFDLALKKQITVYGVSDGSEYLSTAFNLISNKAIDFSPFTFVKHTPDETEQTFATIAKSADDRDISEFHVIQLI